jgi:hypothetical protein
LEIVASLSKAKTAKEPGRMKTNAIFKLGSAILATILFGWIVNVILLPKSKTPTSTTQSLMR